MLKNNNQNVVTVLGPTGVSCQIIHNGNTVYSPLHKNFIYVALETGREYNEELGGYTSWFPGSILQGKILETTTIRKDITTSETLGTAMKGEKFVFLETESKKIRPNTWYKIKLLDSQVIGYIQGNSTADLCYTVREE